MSALIHFGPFEANLAAGELRKNGRRVRIQEQPFQILAALLEHPGEVVTREQLREQLWPGDSFGDFDQGLNTAINKLRDALGDSPADPKFIETLPKRGYRFTFPIAREPVKAPRKHGPWVIASLLAGALAGGLAVWMMRPGSNPEVKLPLRKFTIRPAVPITARIYNPAIAISPNGRHIAFVSGGSDSRLWIRDLDQPSERLMNGTEGARNPFWSPDSEMVGFLIGRQLMKIPAKGGHPVRICDLPFEIGAFGAGWSPTGESIAVAGGNPSKLYDVPATGGVPRLLLSEQAATIAMRSSPDGGQGYFWGPHFFLRRAGYQVLAYSLGYVNPSLMLQDLDTGEVEFLGRGCSPFYAAPGYLIYTRPETRDLWALPISTGGMRANGEAFRVAANAWHPSVSNDGTLVYLETPFAQLAWFDRAGKRMDSVGEVADGIFYPAISPDGQRVAVEIFENANLDVWVLDLRRGSRVRLTADLATDIIPSWSPNGDEVVYGSYRSGSIDVWLRRADGGTEERMLFGSGQNDRVSDWSKDGQHILYSVLDQKGYSDLWYLARGAQGKWEPHSYLKTPADERAAKLSPDGRYVAYLSDESGRMELYVRSFPQGRRKWTISSNGATQPRWSRDGKEIFYAENGTLVAVPVTTTPEFSAGAGRRLFAHPALTRPEREPHYDVSSDRQRILLPQTVGGDGPLIHVVQNWLAEFRGRR